MVYRVEDELADFTILGAPVCASSFFRASFAGALCAGIAPFCRSQVADELSGTRSRTSVTFRIAWRR
jgi:hypothetical protein